MINPIDEAEKWPVVAAVLDAIDPRTDDDKMIDLILEAVRLDAACALAIATSLLRGMLSEVPDVDAVMIRLRRRVVSGGADG